MDLLKVIDIIDRIYKKEFKITIGNMHYVYTDKIKEDIYYKDLIEFLDEYYVNVGQGLKSLIKDFNLPITYSPMRNLVKFLGYKMHSDRAANDFLRKRRKENAKIASENKTGIYSDESQKKIKNKNTSRGIQGYYWNPFFNKFVWLRSSWEYIYAEWLTKKNIKWDVEVKTYDLGETTYRPDFFIFNENNDLVKIVEIKGYWKNRLYKYKILKEQMPEIDMVLITDINPYCTESQNKEIKKWKKLIELKLNQ